MTPEERAQKADRLAKLQRLKQLQEQQAADQAEAVPDSSPLKWLKSAYQGYGTVMGAQQKGLSHLLGSALSKIQGKPVTGDTTSEVMDSAGFGIPDGAELYVPGTPYAPGAVPARPSGISAGAVARGAVDIATDPVTWEGGLLSEASRIPKLANWGEASLPLLGEVSPLRTAHLLVNPVEKGSDLLSNGAYSLASGKLGAWAKKEGLSIMPAQTMRKGAGGFWGGFGQGIHEQPAFFDAMNTNAGNDMGKVATEAGERGIGANIIHDVAPAMLDESSKLAGLSNPNAQAMKEKLLERAKGIYDFYPEGSIPFDQLGKEKSFITKRESWGPKGQFSSQADSDAARIEKQIATGFRNAQESSLERNAPDLAPAFTDAKTRFESTAEVADKAQQISGEVAHQRPSLMPTAVDIGLLGGAAMGSHVALGAFAGKKGLEALRSPRTQAMIGYTADKMYKMGRLGVADRMLQRKSPWSLPEAGNE